MSHFDPSIQEQCLSEIQDVLGVTIDSKDVLFQIVFIICKYFQVSGGDVLNIVSDRLDGATKRIESVAVKEGVERRMAAEQFGRRVNDEIIGKIRDMLNDLDEVMLSFSSGGKGGGGGEVVGGESESLEDLLEELRDVLSELREGGGEVGFGGGGGVGKWLKIFIYVMMFFVMVNSIAVCFLLFTLPVGG